MAEQTEMLKQMSELMTKFINQQVIPSQTVPNPNNKTEPHHVNGKQVMFKDPGPSRKNAQAIRLRSGKETEDPVNQQLNDRKI